VSNGQSVNRDSKPKESDIRVGNLEVGSNKHAIKSPFTISQRGGDVADKLLLER